MPPAKKPAARRASRLPAVPTPTSPITRKEVEEAAARFDKALEEATHALQAIRDDLGKGAKSAYKDIANALKALRRDAQKTNKSLLKDIDKLRASVTPTKAPARSASKGTATRAPARAASGGTTTSRGSGATAKKPASPRSGA
jgi:phosphoenolpyruvate-protein kinase (PTS system EI component)